MRGESGMIHASTSQEAKDGVSAGGTGRRWSDGRERFLAYVGRKEKVG